MVKITISRVPDLRERGGDKEAMLDRSSSSGFMVTILELERRGRKCVKKFSINKQLRNEGDTSARCVVNRKDYIDK